MTLFPRYVTSFDMLIGITSHIEKVWSTERQIHDMTEGKKARHTQCTKFRSRYDTGEP